MKDGWGIFGITGSPPHNGHVAMVAQLAALPWLHTLYVVPTWKPYYKKTISFQHRLRMCVLAFNYMDNVIVSDIERECKFKYTHEVVKEIKSWHKKDPLYLFLGSDWDSDKFVKGHLITKYCSVISLSRCADDSQTLRLKHIEMNSTSIRNRIEERRPVDGFVPNRVLEYIEEEGLYVSKT
jgi:nicotinate-nucleotide adenylyltransferase